MKLYDTKGQLLYQQPDPANRLILSTYSDLPSNQIADGTQAFAQDTLLSYEWYSGAWHPMVSGAGTSSVVEIPGSTTTITNSVAETSIYSYTIPGGDVTANTQFRLTLETSVENTSGSMQSMRLRGKLGGSTVIDYSSGSLFGSGTGERLGNLTVLVEALEPAGTQALHFQWLETNISAQGTLATGNGQRVGVMPITLLLRSADLALDMSANQTLDVTVELGAASAAYTFTARRTVLERLVEA